MAEKRYTCHCGQPQALNFSASMKFNQPFSRLQQVQLPPLLFLSDFLPPCGYEQTVHPPYLGPHHQIKKKGLEKIFIAQLLIRMCNSVRDLRVRGPVRLSQSVGGHSSNSFVVETVYQLVN